MNLFTLWRRRARQLRTLAEAKQQELTGEAIKEEKEAEQGEEAQARRARRFNSVLQFARVAQDAQEQREKEELRLQEREHQAWDETILTLRLLAEQKNNEFDR